MLWGIAVGLLQAATPLLIWWLDRATVYALGLVVIAGIYVGLAAAIMPARRASRLNVLDALHYE